MSDPINPYAPSLETSSPPVEARGNYADLAGTATGLRIMYFGIVLMILCVIGLGVSTAVYPLAAIPLSILLMVAVLMWNIGPFFCLTAPAATRTRSLVIGCIVFQISVLALTTAPWVGARVLATRGVTNLLTFIGTTLFVLAMMRIAKYIRRDDLHAAARRILIGSLVLFVLALCTVVGYNFVRPLTTIPLLLVGLGGIVLFVMYANLVNSLAGAIQSLRG